MLPRPRFGRALEVGCSTGALTEALSDRADHVVAVDRSETALRAATARLADRDDIEVARLDVPGEWPAGSFDLVVVSEVGYFLSPLALDRLVERVATSLAPDGVVVLCHWRHPRRGLGPRRREGAPTLRGRDPAAPPGDVRRPRRRAPRPRHDLAGLRPVTIEHVCIVVPAHDESALLGRQLAALAVATRWARLERPELTVSTTVVLDSCTDGSAEVVGRFADVDAVEVGLGCVGLARRAGIEAARARVSGPPEHTWVACTDADSEVPAHWLAGHLELAATGAGLVLGTVSPDPGELSAGLLRRWRGRHHDLGEGHAHVYGANLGFTLAAYDAVGGFRDRTTGEDVDLVERMKAAGVSWTATSTVPVLTSGRLSGRAPAGFAEYLLSLAR